MPTRPNKNYLSIAKQTRGILDASVPVSVPQLQKTIPPISKIKSKKEAYATTAFWLAVAKSNGEPLKQSDILHFLNKLKGKNNRSRIEIRQILNQGIAMIKGVNPRTQKVKSILSGMEQDGMVESVAETVITALTGTTGSKNAVTTDQGGWKKLAIAVLVVLVAKFAGKRS